MANVFSYQKFQFRFIFVGLGTENLGIFYGHLGIFYGHLGIFYGHLGTYKSTYMVYFASIWHIL
jgi:hypothetical protein